MRIQANLTPQYLPQSRRLCGFLNSLSFAFSSTDLLSLAATYWLGEPTITVWEGDEVRPRAALLAYPEGKLFFMAGTETLRQGFALMSGYGYPAGLPGEGDDDNTHLGGYILNWFTANVIPLIGSNRREWRLAGHSLGGAFCAELVWAAVRAGQDVPQIATFGAPKSFGRRAAAMLSNVAHGLRFMLPSDPVCNIWPSLAEFPALALLNTGLVRWQHPLNDGMVIRDGQITAAYEPPDLTISPPLDLASWLFSLEGNPAHSIPAYYSAMAVVSAGAEAVIVETGEPVQDRALTHRMRLHEPKPDRVIAPFDLGSTNEAIQVRHEFVAQHSPARKFIKVFTWRRKGKKYQVYCNGAAIAWGYHRSTAAATARAGNDLIYRMLTQGLEIDSNALVSSLQQWFDLAADELPAIQTLIRTLKVPLAIR